MRYERTSDKPDLWILGAVLLLLLIGLIMVYSAKLYVDQGFLGRQASRIGLSLLPLALGYFLPLHFWRRGAVVLILMLGMIAALVVVLKYGTLINGARRQWLGIQFSEFAKPVLVLFLAWYFSRLEHVPDEDKGLVRFAVLPLLACVPALALIAREPALSMALVILVLVVLLLVLAEVRLRHLALIGVGTLALLAAIVLGGNTRTMSHARASDAAVAGHVTGDGTAGRYRHFFQRIRSWGQRAGCVFRIQEELSTQRGVDRGLDWQQRQSWIAIGSGGVAGRGLGNGKQKFYFLPMVHTDFIFGLIGEEWGFLGSLVIFGSFLLFMVRGLTIARRAPDTFLRLVAAGAVLAIVHLFVALRLVPPTGQTLPLVSYGMSALAASMFGVGLLLSISKHLVRRPAECGRRNV
jgi:cell division protein FtsW